MDALSAAVIQMLYSCLGWSVDSAINWSIDFFSLHLSTEIAISIPHIQLCYTDVHYCADYTKVFSGLLAVWEGRRSLLATSVSCQRFFHETSGTFRNSFSSDSQWCNRVSWSSYHWTETLLSTTVKFIEYTNIRGVWSLNFEVSSIRLGFQKTDNRHFHQVHHTPNKHFFYWACYVLVYVMSVWHRCVVLQIFCQFSVDFVFISIIHMYCMSMNYEHCAVVS